MESWIIYGLIAAFLIAARDVFTKSFTSKYTITEHLLHYYVLCGVFIAIFAMILCVFCYVEQSNKLTRKLRATFLFHLHIGGKVGEMEWREKRAKLTILQKRQKNI